MSTLTSLARLWAVERGRAQQTCTVRHVHVSDRSLVLVPLTMAGEATAPLAAMVGDDQNRPLVLVVTQPRLRAQRFAFAAELAGELLEYVAGFEEAASLVVSDTDGSRSGVGDAPQIWVPNGAGIKYLGLLGLLTRFRWTVGEYAVPPSVPRLGKWVTFFAEQAEYPGSCLLLAATHVLTAHWATGQSAVEDGNLAAVLAWMTPADGQDGLAGALRTEDPVACPPAGPATDPSFDKEVLAPALAAYDGAASEREQRVATSKLRKVLLEQMQPTWDAVWQAINLIRTLPPAGHVHHRWQQDRAAFARYSNYMGGEALPQPRHDNAVTSARRLNEMERRRAVYDAQRAIDDPLVMAEHRLTGEAFTGVVIEGDFDRVTCAPGGRRPRLRPLITVRTGDPVRINLEEDAFRDHARPLQKASMIAVSETGDGLNVQLELAGGMGSGLTPPPDSVPGIGERVCYCVLKTGYQQRGEFPPRDATPWTHGGPPEQPQSDPADDGREDWS